MTIKKILCILGAYMADLKIKEDYRLSNCCSPLPDDAIVGYYSHDNFIKIHKNNCTNIKNIDQERLISVIWADILCNEKGFQVTEEYKSLSKVDFLALLHHEYYGLDYSLMLAKKLNTSKQEGFDIHQKLRDLQLIERVEPKEIQYRKGIVPNKWIKHRNHTYYDLTEKGKKYLAYYKSDAS